MRDAWYYADRNGKVGPLSLKKLRETLAAFSTANASDVLVWHEGFPDWKPAEDVPELNEIQTPLPPPLPNGFTRNEARERTSEPQSSEPTAPMDFDERFSRVGAKVILGLIGASVIFLFLNLLPSNPNSSPEQSKVVSAPHVVANVNAVKPLADQGDASAQYKLGVMYENGDGVPKDYVLAYRYFNFSAAQGNKGAEKGLDKVARLMTPAQIAEAKEIGPICHFGYCVSPASSAEVKAKEAQRLAKLDEAKKLKEAECAQFTNPSERRTCLTVDADYVRQQCFTPSSTVSREECERRWRDAGRAVEGMKLREELRPLFEKR
jgi:hypothetical protein